MKKQITRYVRECPTGESRTSKTKRPLTTVRDFIMEMGHIIMDFVVGLPQTQAGNNFFCVVVDRLTKSTHFLPMKTTTSLNSLTDLYFKEIVKPHGISVLIVSDRDTRFTLRF